MSIIFLVVDFGCLLLKLFLPIFVANVQPFSGHRLTALSVARCTPSTGKICRWPPILRDRRMLLPPLPLLLFLTAREFILTWSPAVCCVSATRHDHVDRNKGPKHRHVLTLALNIFFGHVDITQCEAVFRSHCFAERFGSQMICKVLLPLDSSQPLGSNFTLHPQVCHKYVTSMCFIPIHCPWKMCSVNPDLIICCLRVYAFSVLLPSSITPALDNFRVSLQPAQSESENVVTSSTILPQQRHVLVFAPSCLAQVQSLSRARRHVCARPDTQIPRFLQCSLLFNALMLSVDP